MKFVKGDVVIGNPRSNRRYKAFLSGLILAIGIATIADTCMKPCSKMYQPVCGTNSVSGERQSFTNACLLENHNCEFPAKKLDKVSDGECTNVGARLGDNGSGGIVTTIGTTLGPIKFANQ